MPLPATSVSRDPVKQFSVFAENRVGRLFDQRTITRLAVAQGDLDFLALADVADHDVTRRPFGQLHRHP